MLYQGESATREEFCKQLPPYIFSSVCKTHYAGSTKPQPNYLYQAQARTAVIYLGLFQKKKKNLQTFFWLLQKSNAFLRAQSQVTQEINATHRPGWREHGLIKGKADFGSCSSCTDRQKTQKKLTTQTSFCWGPLPLLLQVLEGRRGQRHSRGRVLMHKWNGAAGSWHGRE